MTQPSNTIPSTSYFSSPYQYQLYERNLMNSSINYQNKYLNNQYNNILSIDNDIININSDIQDLQNKAAVFQSNNTGYPQNKAINTIKSNYNNQLISTIPLSDPDTYQININNQCVSVYGRDNVSLKQCQSGLSATDSQKFKAYRIQNQLIAQNIFGKNTTNTNVIYPYNVFIANMTNQCLTLNQDGDAILQDCNPDNINQQWKISPNQNICLD